MNWILMACALGFSAEGERMSIPKFVPRISFLGWEYWSDVAVADGCRLQRHAVYEGFRLLDAKNRCVATGSLDECRSEFARRREQGLAKPFQGEVVLLMHGVLRSSRNMAGLASRLKEQGFTVVRLDYASNCLTIEKHAVNFGHVVANLDHAERIHVVCHSMGGLVVRRYLASGADRRIKRVVLLGTPNQGSEIADAFSDLKLFGLIFGPAGKELCTDQKGHACAMPQGIEAAVIAGGVGKRVGFNPFLKADNDGIVTVDSAKLPGISDFLRLPVVHGGMMRSADVAEATARFLKTGRLRAAVPAKD
jgi:pimeloyl-ACP methyl ester carboxylesterase